MAQQVITPADLDSEFAVVGNKVSLKLLAPLYQDGATGAIGVTGVTAKQYLQVYRGTTVQGLAANQDVIFNEQGLANGIAYNVATGVATLTGGKVYRLTVALATKTFTSVNTWLRCNFVDALTNLFLVANLPPLEVRMVTSTITGFSPAYLDLVYAPATNQTIKLRCIGASGGTCQIRFDAYSGLVIQEL